MVQPNMFPKTIMSVDFKPVKVKHDVKLDEVNDDVQSDKINDDVKPDAQPVVFEVDVCDYK